MKILKHPIFLILVFWVLFSIWFAVEVGPQIDHLAQVSQPGWHKLADWWTKP